MTTAGDVFLDRVLVGELVLDAGGLVAFRFVDSYREMAVRPILGQSTALAIRRFDRGPGGARIHQEDFAQVMGRTRRRFSNGRYKYSSTMEALAFLAMSIAGTEGYTELIRRLAFVIASGNHDAHLKNWSLLYPDGRSATLSPLYDQVCTVAWPEHDRTMALKVAATRNPGELDAARMEHLAKKVGADAAITSRIVEETIAAARSTFTTEMKPRLTTAHAAALVEHWSRVPLLRSNGPLVA